MFQLNWKFFCYYLLLIMYEVFFSQELADQIGVTLASPGESPVQGEEGAGGPAPPIPDGKPCKWWANLLIQ